MAVDWGLDFDLSDWAGPASLATGGLLALLIFCWGRLAVSRRLAPPPPAPAETSPPDPPPYSKVRERRPARHPGSQVAVLIADALGQEPPYRGIVIDRSVGGVRLGVDQAVEVGTVLRIRPAHAPPMVPWTPVEVKHQRRAAGGWVLTCQFVQPPPSTVLWMFG